MYRIEGETNGYQAPCWCDEFVIKPDGDILFASIFGSGIAVKAITAQILTQRKIQFIDTDTEKPICGTYGTKIHVTRAEGNIVRATGKSINNVVAHRILYSENKFMPWLYPITYDFLVYGESEDKLPALAFKIINKFCRVPLKASWADWLWDHITIKDEAIVTSEEKSPCFRFCQIVKMPDDESLHAWIMEDLDNLNSIGAEEHDCNIAIA